MQLVLASGNAGKLAELNAILGGDGYTLVTQGSLGVDDVPETGLTFVENALIKARHAARITGLPALADDSGLCVDALGGAPGLYSARYAGSQGDAEANLEKLLQVLQDVRDEARTAHSPYATASPPSRGYYDSLIAKAVALYDGHDYVVMVKTDMIGMLDEVVQDVKADVKARRGIDLGDGLIMSATHSHDGPGALANHSTRYFWLAMDAYQHDVYRKLIGQLGDVVIAALDALKPARIGHGKGLEAPETGNGNGINGYRRGRLDTYDDDDAPGCAFVPAAECPAGIDDANELRKRIGILRVDDAATGAPIAVPYARRGDA